MFLSHPRVKAGPYLGGEAWSCRVSRASRYREASQAALWATSTMGTCQGSKSHKRTASLGGDVSGPWRRPALSKLSFSKLFSPYIPQPGLSSTQRNVSCLSTLLPQHRGCSHSYLALQELYEGTPQSLAPSQVLAQAWAGMAASIEDLQGRGERCIPAQGQGHTDLAHFSHIPWLPCAHLLNN